MDTGLESYALLENQVDKIANLVAKLKEENVQLRKENERLKNQCNSLKIMNSQRVTTSDGSGGTILTPTQAESIRRHVRNALTTVSQLREAVS